MKRGVVKQIACDGWAIACVMIGVLLLHQAYRKLTRRSRSVG